jgi:hypothetical protein
MSKFIPGFKNHPKERFFADKLDIWLKAQSTEPMYVDGIFDILVTGTRDKIDRFIELKVCLKSNGNIPISAKQWKLIHSLPKGFDDRARILIYRHSDKCYSLCRYSNLKDKITGKRYPDTTSYVKKATLNNEIEWIQGNDCASRLSNWIHTGA